MVLEKMPEVQIQQLWVTLGIVVNSATAMCNTQQGIYYQREILLLNSPIPLTYLLQKIFPPPYPPPSRFLLFQGSSCSSSLMCGCTYHWPNLTVNKMYINIVKDKTERWQIQCCPC